MKSWRTKRLMMMGVPFLIGAMSLAMTLPAPSIQTLREPTFGVVERRGTVELPWSDEKAGEIAVTGRAGARALLHLTIGDAVAGEERMGFAIGEGHAAFSLDTGRTWSDFDVTALTQEVTFPAADAEGLSMILVRIGGRLSASSVQARGCYTVPIDLDVEYLDETRALD